MSYREGEREKLTSVYLQTKPGESRRGRCDTVRHQPESGALCRGVLLPDHNQMCQVCPNRNDCVKAIFSNLSDFSIPPPLLYPLHLMPPERQIQTLEEHTEFQTGSHKCSLHSLPPAQSCDERYTV